MSTTGDPITDAAIPAAANLVRAIRNDDHEAVAAAVAQAAADVPPPADPMTVLAFTLAAMVADLRQPLASVDDLLAWCTPPEPLPAGPQPLTLPPLKVLPGGADIVITDRCGRLVATRDTPWADVTDALVDLDDRLEALPAGIEREALQEQRDRMFRTWQALTDNPTVPVEVAAELSPLAQLEPLDDLVDPVDLERLLTA